MPARQVKREKCRSTPEIVRLAHEAVSIHDACNLSGLAQRFAKVMIELRQHPDCTGTDWANQHPIVKCWISKFEHLAQMEQEPGVAAYLAVSDLSEGKDVEFTITPL